MLIHLIAAARPNFMKIAPLYHALKQEKWASPVIVHTGQHYDFNMSDAFFSDLNLPEPHIHLGVGSGSHAEQTAHVMVAYEKIIQEKRPNLVVVVGDVNSTLACSLAAIKVVYHQENITNSINRPLVAHLEAGLRSFDRTMPEEINRLATDAIADILWTPSPDGDENLIKEGIPKDKIDFVGNIMIDSLEMMRDKIENNHVFSDYGLKRREYGIVTFHRPANVDFMDNLSSLCKVLIDISREIPIIFPVHPRTRKKLCDFGLVSKLEQADSIILTEPLNYVRFMNLVFNCRIAITDSGGIQEETTYLGIPCLTMRPNTERPITVTKGTNSLCTLNNLQAQAQYMLSTIRNDIAVPELWDGKTANRVVQAIRRRFVNK